MNVKALQAKQQAASEEFDKLQAEKKNLTARLNDIETLCAQLKGAYDAYQKLIDEIEAPADQADVIDVEPTLKDMDKKKGKK